TQPPPPCPRQSLPPHPLGRRPSPSRKPTSLLNQLLRRSQSGLRPSPRLRPPSLKRIGVLLPSRSRLGRRTSISRQAGPPPLRRRRSPPRRLRNHLLQRPPMCRHPLQPHRQRQSQP